MCSPMAFRLALATFLLLSVFSRLGAQTLDTPSSGAHFTDVADSLGPYFTARAYHTTTKYLLETMGSGVATFEYDNDGLLDVLLLNGAPLNASIPHGAIPQKRTPADWNRLYHQKKDGTFEDVTEKSGLQGVGYGMGVAVGDYDKDGFEDVYVTAYGGNRLYHNTGKGTFVDVTQRSGTGGETQVGQGWSTSAAWVDLDNDGKLDLVVLRYVKWDFDDTWCGEHREGYRAYCHPNIFPAIRPLVYRNNGDGTFTECADKFGLFAPGKGLGIAVADFNLDGRIDLAIASDSMPQFLYRNKCGYAYRLDRSSHAQLGRAPRGPGGSVRARQPLARCEERLTDTVKLYDPHRSSARVWCALRSSSGCPQILRVSTCRKPGT